MSSVGAVGRAVEQYLVERRSLGFDLKSGVLLRFARYADSRGYEGALSADIQIAWAQEPGKRTTSSTARRRLEDLRPFVRHYCQFAPDSAIVEPSLLGPPRCRLAPHIYHTHEIDALLIAAAKLSPFGTGLRPATYSTLFGLLAATGMRVSEALNLTDEDVRTDGRQLVVRQTKFRKSRQLPLHESTASALLAYRRAREQYWSGTGDQHFFVGGDGTYLKMPTVQGVFKALRSSLGWSARGDHAQPRIHDLRHTFAVRRVQSWHEQSVPIEQAMFWLCTYLGHAKISDTYWYLTGVPELMAIAGQCFETFACASECQL